MMKENKTNLVNLFSWSHRFLFYFPYCFPGFIMVQIDPKAAVWPSAQLSIYRNTPDSTLQQNSQYIGTHQTPQFSKTLRYLNTHTVSQLTADTQKNLNVFFYSKDVCTSYSLGWMLLGMHILNAYFISLHIGNPSSQMNLWIHCCSFPPGSRALQADNILWNP